jgi:hypothetical protein
MLRDADGARWRYHPGRPSPRVLIKSLERNALHPFYLPAYSPDKAGYAPACRNEWVRGICEKPRIKCTDCRNQAFVTRRDDRQSIRTGRALLYSLKRTRPKAADKEMPRHPAWRKQRPQRKIVRPKNLKRLTRHFLTRRNEFSIWVAGYLQIASRIPSRPGEVIAMRLKGRVLSAPAEKVSDERGLADTVEIIIGDRYPEKYIARLRSWIAGRSAGD